MKSITICALVVQPLVLSIAVATIPQQFQYQWSLTRSNGTPLDTMISLTLRLHDAPAGGTVLWTETYPGVTVRRGLFHVTMGKQAPSYRIIS
jgi:hypothetical protein